MNKSAFLGMVVSVFALVSCGGHVNTIPGNIVLPGSPQLYTGNVTYVAGTEEYNAFYAINTFRASVGLGYWDQSIYLDQAANNHINYSNNNVHCKNLATPMQYMDDLETDVCPEFTGTTPSARAIAQGFYILENTTTQLNVPTAAVGELYSVGSGSTVVAAMVNTIYHRSGLMDQSTRYMGLARSTSGPILPGAATPTYWWISHGKLDGGQSVASNYLGRYPIDQQVGVPLHMCAEFPSVYQNVSNDYFDTNTSSPVSLTASALIQLTPTTFTVTPAGSSTPLPGKVWTMYNDPNLNTTNESLANLTLSDPPAPVPTIAANQAFWVGTAPFLPNTTYTVVVSGTTFLTAYAITNPLYVSWTFTTGTSTTCELP